MHNTITIIGSVHEATKNYTADDLYQKLCEIKPDIILFEFPMEWEKDLQARINYGVKTKNVESIAFEKFAATHDVIVKPYDIEGRNSYYMKTKYFEKEEQLSKAYDTYFKSSNPNPAAVAYKKLLRKNGRIQREWDKKSLSEINSPACDIVTEAYINISHTAFLAVLELVPELTPYKAGHQRMQNYEVKRNKAMVKNILDYNRQYDNKSIVVLCGYYHRYALIKLLQGKQAKEGFVLR